MIYHHENHVNYSLTSIPTTWLLVGYRNIKQVATCTHVRNVTTTTYTCAKWTWRTELQKENVLRRVHMCMCACVLKGNQLQGANVEYVLLNREKPEATPFTRWDLHYTISIYLTK
jgi:hypothetical protein